MDYRYFINGCTFCGTCVSLCPEEAIKMTGDGAIIEQSMCIGCGICYDNCPYEAVKRLEIEKEALNG